MAMRQRALDLQVIRARPDQCAALEDRFSQRPRGRSSLLKLASVRFCGRPVSSR